MLVVLLVMSLSSFFIVVLVNKDVPIDDMITSTMCCMLFIKKCIDVYMCFYDLIHDPGTGVAAGVGGDADCVVVVVAVARL